MLALCRDFLLASLILDFLLALIPFHLESKTVPPVLQLPQSFLLLVRGVYYFLIGCLRLVRIRFLILLTLRYTFAVVFIS